MLGTTLGKVRSGRTVGGYISSSWTSCTSQVEIIHQTDSFHFMRHHSCRLRRSPAVPYHSRPSSTVPGRPRLSPAVSYHHQPSTPRFKWHTPGYRITLVLQRKRSGPGFATANGETKYWHRFMTSNTCFVQYL